MHKSRKRHISAEEQVDREESPNKVQRKCWENEASYSQKSTCDQDSIQYFTEVSAVFDEGFEDDHQKEMFVNNVLEQTVDKEIELSCDRTASHCIELLLEHCADTSIIIRFMEAFCQNLKVVCMDQCASHIAEKLVHACLLAVKNLIINPTDAEEKESIKSACIFWTHQFGLFCLENWELCLEDTYGCHVLSAVIQVLGCCRVDESTLHSRKMQSKTQEKYTGYENALGITETIPSPPKIFLRLLKKISKKILECSRLPDLVFDPRLSPLIQVLLMVLKKRRPKFYEKRSKTLLTQTFSRRNHEGVPMALCDKSCSYLMEKILVLSDEHQQQIIWDGISPYLPQLVLHPIGNYIIQKFFHCVHSKQQFESMFDATTGLFDSIRGSKYFGIFMSLSKTCNRLKTRQAQFLTAMMEMFNCSKPAERNAYFVKLLLGLETFDEHQRKIQTQTEASSLSIHLHGSLLLQEILKFLKPIKVVKNILGLKPEMLAFLANHEQGCYVLISFLQSTNISGKDKTNLIELLKPQLATIACNLTGNMTLCRLWPMLSIEQRHIIAKELLEKKSLIQQHKWGIIILKKFAIFQFEHRKDEWKQIQHAFAKKQQMLKEILTSI